MRRVFGKRGVVVASVIVSSILASGVAASGFSRSSTRFDFASVGSASASLTERDVAASNEKIRMAAGALAAMWSTDFAKVGTRFAVPGFVRCELGTDGDMAAVGIIAHEATQ